MQNPVLNFHTTLSSKYIVNFIKNFTVYREGNTNMSKVKFSPYNSRQLHVVRFGFMAIKLSKM